MKKQGINYVFIFLLSLLCYVTHAQDNSLEALQNEVANLKKQLLEEKEKTNYLKEALDIRNNGLELTSDSVTIKLVEVKGNSTENTIVVKGLITYRGKTKWKLQFANHQIVDPNANTTEQSSAVKPNDLNKSFYIEGAEADIPYGFVINFEKVEKTPTLSLLRVQIYKGGLYHGVIPFNFKGVDVVWE